MTETLSKTHSLLTLNVDTAADLMTPNPVSIRDAATVLEAISMLTTKGISAAPVIDNAGRPVGVLSQSDILVHDRNNVKHLKPYPEFYHRSELTLESGESLVEGFQVESPDSTQVREIMTPAVFSVTPDVSAKRVVQDMLSLKVHRLFVVDRTGVLVGVISALDVLRCLD
jgi:CBS domain-containing protein